MRLRLFIALPCLLFVACTNATSTIVPLPSDEVLSKAASATHSLQSAKYLLTGNVSVENDPLWTTDATVRMDGIIRDAGEQMRFQMDVDATTNTLDQEYVTNGTLEVVVASQDEVYMNLHSLTVQPPSSIVRPDLVGKLASKWWILPKGDSLPLSSQVTPDPRLLQAQSQVVRVVKDNGLVAVDGHMVYDYMVELDTEKLIGYMQKIAGQDPSFDAGALRTSLKDVQGTGELWIDAETFFVQKLSWNIQSYPLQTGGNTSLDFSVTFTDHNEAPEIIPPKDAKEFSPYDLLTLSEQDYENLEATDLTDAEINSILHSLDAQ